ncbi:magnesium-translocating P-type ATPase [Aminobacter sp. DSM 101952]|uniref:magnesium-translocating P-type ATPase n=1 Tax=Aminobacter TaxID=31988 RepID=UPI0006FEA8B0|nr:MULTISPECIES: magnesium-translocating P-type ATPase [Aminobacter]AWC23736.1 Magnesium-transporting ATPase, P-type 1 [Aminobacter sp. MSH1]KQU70041.1 magnesium-translocating P-type ATPase [Aminobacter sp. DSM 101952]CAI2934417.1 Magnesium-transporting ATPase, P-type 1 [Aminobacter niigataensis]
MNPQVEAFWSRPLAEVMAALDTQPNGLSSAQASRRRKIYGPNAIEGRSAGEAARLLLRQLRSPLVLILMFAATISFVMGERQEALIICLILLASCGLGFTQEYGASKAVAALKRQLLRKVMMLRDGIETEVAVDEVVPGDILKLSAGDLVAADGLIVEARDFNVSEAVLTGESFPVVKSPGVVAADSPIGGRTNSVFTGTSVRSGTAIVLAVATGRGTEFAGIADAVEKQIDESGFAKGIRRFGYLMTEVMLAIVIVVFVVNLLLDRPLTESLLFSLALAVGLTPELLPAIISVTLARGAAAMAKSGVIVRRLEAIENLGSMDVLCTDKTGTLTEGAIKLDRWTDAKGRPSEQVLAWAGLNASLQTGIKNPLDEAIVAAIPERQLQDGEWLKVDELPYDFIRKRLSVVVRVADNKALMICKGAVRTVLDVSASVIDGKRTLPLSAERKRKIDQTVQRWSEQGFRVLALALREVEPGDKVTRDDETGLTLAGFLLFFDPPKEGVAGTLRDLAKRGVSVKMISGDDRHVAKHLAKAIGLSADAVMTGSELMHLTKDALFARVTEIDIFAEIDPNQKEHIVEALKRRGKIVGYLGDGINDAPALHQADVGISVEHAVDVAREAADIILLKRDLGVLMLGIDDGRKTFANTMKYIAITTSANFGNMTSMAIASLFLPFLPLLAKQILLNNFLSDLPALAIATDHVDIEETRRPRRWDIGFIRRFMVRFGLASSFFDAVTFAFLLFVVDASPSAFQTGWFTESLLTELAIVLVIRTHKPAWRSRPSRTLTMLTIAVGVVAVALPYLPIAAWFGFEPLPLPVLGGLLCITAAYAVTSEWLKMRFFAASDRPNTDHRWPTRRAPLGRSSVRSARMSNDM